MLLLILFLSSVQNSWWKDGIQNEAKNDIIKNRVISTKRASVLQYYNMVRLLITSANG